MKKYKLIRYVAYHAEKGFLINQMSLHPSDTARLTRYGWKFLKCSIEITPLGEVYKGKPLPKRKRKPSDLILSGDIITNGYNVLKDLKIETIDQLSRCDEQMLLKYRNFGKKSLLMCIDLLHEADLTFGMSPRMTFKENGEADV